KMMRPLIAGSMARFGDASLPTLSAGITSFAKVMRSGERREMAPVLCAEMSCAQSGSAGATVGVCDTGMDGVQLVSRAAATRAAQAYLNMEPPECRWFEAGSVHRPRMGKPWRNCGKQVRDRTPTRNFPAPHRGPWR